MYGFAREGPASERRVVPTQVRSELGLVFAFALLFEADLRREWAPMLTTTDASVEYGFGASVADVPVFIAMSVRRKAEKRGNYIRLSRGGAGDEPGRPRLGNLQTLQLPRRPAGQIRAAWRHCLSARQTVYERRHCDVVLRLRHRRQEAHAAAGLLAAQNLQRRSSASG